MSELPSTELSPVVKFENLISRFSPDDSQEFITGTIRRTAKDVFLHGGFFDYLLERYIELENALKRFKTLNLSESGKVLYEKESREFESTMQLYLKFCAAGLELSVEERGEMDNMFLTNLLVLKIVISQETSPSKSDGMKITLNSKVTVSTNLDEIKPIPAETVIRVYPLDKYGKVDWNLKPFDTTFGTPLVIVQERVQAMGGHSYFANYPYQDIPDNIK